MLFICHYYITIDILVGVHALISTGKNYSIELFIFAVMYTWIFFKFLFYKNYITILYIYFFRNEYSTPIPNCKLKLGMIVFFLSRKPTVIKYLNGVITHSSIYF